MLYHQTNVRISNFCNLKLCIKDKFINRIVNNILFELNLICMLEYKEHEIQLLNFQNLH